MRDKQPTPLQASFWLTRQEQGYILAIGVILLVGIASRYFYLKKEVPKVYTPAGIEEAELSHE